MRRADTPPQNSFRNDAGLASRPIDRAGTRRFALPRMRWLRVVCLLQAICIACGSAPEPRTPADETPSHEVAEPQADAKPRKRAKAKKKKRKEWKEQTASFGKIPTKCSKRKMRGECLPPEHWVEKLCDGVYPDVALHMFRPGTPWQRFYMVARAEPYNASGGMSLLGEKLEYGEEVIALRRRTGRTGVQVGDTSGYDVLRWNGACATIHDGDFTTKPPSVVRHSRVEWRKLSLDIRTALEADPRIAEVYEARRRHCRGATLGRVTKECEEYDIRLVEEVVRHVRSGVELPRPGKVP